MERFSKLLKDNLTTIMKILVSLFLCIVCSYWMGPETDYSLFVSMITGISIIAFIYEFLFTKKYKDALINILCAFSIFIATNHLYSTARLVEIYNKFNEFDKLKLTAIIMGVFTAIVTFFLIVYLFKNRKKFYNHNNLKNEYVKKKCIDTLSKSEIKPMKTFEFNKEKAFYIITTIGIVLFLVVVIYIFFKFDIEQLINMNSLFDVMDYAKTVLIYAGIILSALVIIAIIVAVIVSIVKLVRIIVFKDSQKKLSSFWEKNSDNFIYFVSLTLVIITFVVNLFFNPDIDKDRFINILLEAEFLAFPLIVLAAIIIFGLLTNITHVILLSLPKIPSEKIEKDVKEEVQEKIIQISHSLFFAILDLIGAAIEFVAFVPDFFTSINKLISDEENEDENDT